MEENGIITKSRSPWASPLCLVVTKNGKIRPCVDYRKLNAVTNPDAFPLPRVQDCLDAGAKYFPHLTSLQATIKYLWKKAASQRLPL